MRSLITFGSCLLSLCVALENSGGARTLSSTLQNDGTGPFSYSYETSDGVKKEETGNPVPSVHEDNTLAIVVKGSYSYTGADGVVYTVRYTADESGFHPEGDHFKVPPFVPWVKGQPFDASGQYTHETFGERRPGTTPPTTGERILDTYRTTPKPVYLPPTPKPQPVPEYSHNLENTYIPPKTENKPYYYEPPTPKFTSGESILDTYRLPETSTSAPQYLPPLQPNANENNVDSQDIDIRFNGPTPQPHPTIILHSTPPSIHKKLPVDNINLFIPNTTPAAVKNNEQRTIVAPRPFQLNNLDELNPQIKSIINSLR